MAKKAVSLEIRNRITGMQFIKGRDLQDNVGNFRVHPQHQRDVLRGVLKEIGIVGALLVYQSARQGGLTVIDGHLRKGDFPEQEWPCLMTDLDDAEADYILLMYDELSRQAEREKAQVAALMDRVQSGETAVQALIAKMHEEMFPVVQLPDPDIPAEPILKSEMLIEIRCSKETFARIEPICVGWEAEYADCTINVS